MAITLGASGVTFPDGTTQTSTYADRGLPISMQMFTSTGTYTVPATATRLFVQLTGGGGGSAGYCESGGAGGYAEGTYAVTGGATYTVTVGAAGAGVGYYAAAGVGGTTSFGALLSATGGWGANNNSSHGGGHGGNSFGGAQASAVGGTGAGHGNTANHASTPGGGASFFGGTGTQNRNSTTAQNNGPAWGAGAPGARTNDGGAGCAGTVGACIIIAYT